MLGLPDQVSACLFDMDGVITRTATVHDAAWKEMFDEFLRARATDSGGADSGGADSGGTGSGGTSSGGTDGQFTPFDPVKDYDDYVDGKPRIDGTRAFLASRGIDLPEGTPDDPPGTPTLWGLGNRKNELFLQVLKRDGVEVYDGSRRYLAAVRSAGLRTALVSSSANTTQVLKIGGVADQFDVTIDGHVAEAEGLRGKPAPDTYLAAAKQLGVDPASAAVFEDALAGVESGRAGKFGFVVGVDRVGQAAQLREHGATVVVTDLADLLPGEKGKGEKGQRT